jgi:hypothetical protein
MPAPLRFKTALVATMMLTASALSAHACKTPTQVTLDLRSSNDCSALRGVHIGVAGTPVEAEGRIGAYLTAEAPKCAAGSREIGTLVVTPGESGRAAVIVVAGVSAEAKECARPDYKGCVVARRSLSFVESTALVIPIFIDFACKDVPCDVETTCKNGECIDARLDCGEDGCVSRDPRGRDEDGGTIDGAARDGAKEGAQDVIVPPNDGSSNDATNDTTFTGICPYKCPPAQVDCIQGTACCFNMVAQPHCAVPAKCENPDARSVPGGLSVCCSKTSDCSGSACCAKYQTKNPFRGTATCRVGSQYCPPGEQQFCETNADCPGMAECTDCGNLDYEQIANLKCCAP